MLKLKFCSRCNGNLYLEKDTYTGSWCTICLQCGSRTYISRLNQQKESTALNVDNAVLATLQSSSGQSSDRIKVTI
jgi:hypothetical protein